MQFEPQGLCVRQIIMRFKEKFDRDAIGRTVDRKFGIFTDYDFTEKWWGIWDAKRYAVSTAYPHGHFRNSSAIWVTPSVNIYIGSIVTKAMQKELQKEADRMQPKIQNVKM